MYLEVFKQEERFGLRFWRLNDREKGMTNIFSCFKLTSKLYLVIKLPENGRGMASRGEQAPNKVLLLFLDVKMLRESLTDVSRRCKPTSKVRRM